MASRPAQQVNNPQIGTHPVPETSTSDVRGAQAAQVDGQGGRQPQAGSTTSDQQGESKDIETLINSSGDNSGPKTSAISSTTSAKQEQQQSGPEPLVIVNLREEVEVLKSKIKEAAALQEKNQGKKAPASSNVATRKLLEEEKKTLTRKFREFEFEERLAVNILKLKEDIKKAEARDFASADYSEKPIEGKTPEGPSAEELVRIEEAEAEALGQLFRTQHTKLVEKAQKTPGGKPQKSNTSDIENQLPKVCLQTIEDQLTPQLPETYLEIKRLLWVDGQKVHKKALEVWRDKEVLFTKRVERKKGKVAELKNEVYQLIGFFSVFQGVVLTTVAQSSLLHCNNRWSPISLSVLASIVTIAGVVQKLIHISEFQETVHSEEQSLKEVIARASDLRKQGEAFRFAKFYNNREKTKQKKSHQVFYSAFVIISLLAFTVLFPVSHVRILCP